MKPFFSVSDLNDEMHSSAEECVQYLNAKVAPLIEELENRFAQGQRDEERIFSLTQELERVNLSAGMVQRERLMKELERVKAENERLKAGVNKVLIDNARLEAASLTDIEKWHIESWKRDELIWIEQEKDLKARLKAAEDVLRYYADPNSWDWTTHESTRDGQSCGDFDVLKLRLGEGYTQVAGKKARAYFEREKKD